MIVRIVSALYALGKWKTNDDFGTVYLLNT
jgi:hypothetical protein